MLFEIWLVSTCHLVRQKFCSIYNLVQKRKFIAFFDSKAHVSNAAQHFLLIEPGHLKFGYFSHVIL